MKKIILAMVGLLLLLVPILTSCGTSASMQRDEAVRTRAEMFARAEKLYPVPNTKNFPARESLIKYTERQDEPHVYYVYVITGTGTILGYYVAQSFPVSTNAFLSSTEDITQYGIATAPSLDGIYYGGSGSSSGSGWFFFDATTNALVTIYGDGVLGIFVADQPLKVDAPRFEISASITMSK